MSQETAVFRDLIFDVGLHKGEDTDFYLAKGFRVVAFEADPQLAAQARTRFKTAIADGRLSIVEGAICDVDGPTVRFYRNPDRSEWGTVDPRWVRRNEALGSHHQDIEVAVVDFEKAIRQHGMPYYMKIDIEGADRTCLEALKQFPIRPSYLSIESEKVDFERLVEEIRILESLGYRDFLPVQQADVMRTSQPARTSEGRDVTHRFPAGASGLFGQDLTGWKQSEEAIEDYRGIFDAYKRFGDDTLWQKNIMGRALLKGWSEIRRSSIPGWYDTHARLGDSPMAATPYHPS